MQVLGKDLEVEECHVKTIIVFFNKFYDFFGRPHSLMNEPWCRHNNIFEIMQYSNFRNLNRVIFTQ